MISEVITLYLCRLKHITIRFCNFINYDTQIQESSKKQEVIKNIAGKEKSKVETKISITEETNKATKYDVII